MYYVNVLHRIRRLLLAQKVCFSRHGKAAIAVTVMGWARTWGRRGFPAMDSDYEATMLLKNRRESHPMEPTHFITGESDCSMSAGLTVFSGFDFPEPEM